MDRDLAELVVVPLCGSCDHGTFADAPLPAMTRALPKSGWLAATVPARATMKYSDIMNIHGQRRRRPRGVERFYRNTRQLIFFLPRVKLLLW